MAPSNRRPEGHDGQPTIDTDDRPAPRILAVSWPRTALRSLAWVVSPGPLVPVVDFRALTGYAVDRTGLITLLATVTRFLNSGLAGPMPAPHFRREALRTQAWQLNVHWVKTTRYGLAAPPVGKQLIAIGEAIFGCQRFGQVHRRPAGCGPGGAGGVDRAADQPSTYAIAGC